MKTLHINEKSFTLEKDVHKFLSDYLERIENFVQKNGIEADLYQDILQRFSDKLTEKAQQKDGITQKVAIHIVNDLGEAEEIFAEELELDLSISEKKPEKKSDFYFYEKLQNSNRNRPQQGAILLGVCQMFAQLTDWNVRVWRGLALFASWVFLASGMGSAFIFGWFVYFVLALIFPRKEKNYHQRSVLNYFLTQIWDLRLVVSNSLKWFFGFCRWVLLVAFPTAIKWLSKLFGPLWKGIKTLFLIGRSGFLLFIIIGLMVGLYFLINGFVQNNIDLSTAFPAFMRWGVVLGIISAFLLLLHSIGILFKKKLSNTATLITAIGSGVLAISIAIISGIMMFQDVSLLFDNFYVSSKPTIEKELIIPIQNLQQPLVIDLENTTSYNHHRNGVLNLENPIQQEGLVTIIPYTGNDIKAVYSYSLYGPLQKKKNLDQVIEKLSDPIYEMQNEKLNIFLKGHQILDQLSPFVLGKISVTLYIPTDLKFKLQSNGGLGRLGSNLARPERTKKYGYSGKGQCSDWISYDEKENNFFCPMDIDSDVWGRRKMVEGALREQADTLSPIVGSNTDRSRSDGSSSYWGIHSFLWEGKNRVIIKLSDQFFNLWIAVDFQVTQEGELKIINKKLTQLEQKGTITPERLQFYRGFDAIKKEFPIVIEKGETQDQKLNENYISREEFNQFLDKLEENAFLSGDHRLVD